MKRTNTKPKKIFVSTGIIEKMEEPGAKEYLTLCLLLSMAGKYGTASAEEKAANKKELAAGSGHIIARYKNNGMFKSDICIKAYFDYIQYTYIYIGYPEEL